MADTDNPFARFKTQPDVPAGPGIAAPAVSAVAPASDNPFAKFKGTGKKTEEKEGPSTLTDVAKTAAPSLLRGTLGAITAPRAISDLVGQGVNWTANKIAPQGVADAANKFHNWDSGLGANGFPSYDELKSGSEKITGPLYDAKTPVGKAAQAGIEVVPSLLAGGEGLVPAAAKSVGSGALSGGLGELAHAFQDHLPTWAEPVARGVGSMLGTGLPATARRAVTPLPMNDAQHAAVAALGPDFPMTAGQATQSPKLMGLEAHSPRMQAVPGQQAEAFTGRALNEAGINSHDFHDIGQGDAVGQRLGALYRSGQIDAPNFNQLLRTIGTERRGVQRVAGVGNTPQIDQVRDMTRYGAMNNGQPVLNMPGPRYEFMRGELQRRLEAAGNPQEKLALGNIRNAMDQGFNNTTGLGPQIEPLQQQYANWNVLKNIKPEVGRTTITPQEVTSAVAHNWGNAAANQGRGSLVPLAENADRVMSPLPKPSEAGGKVTRLMGAGLAGLFGGGLGYLAHSPLQGADLGGLYAILGGERAADLANTAWGAAGRAMGSHPAQAYLGNQAWRPGANSTAPRIEDLVRLLGSPGESQRLSGTEPSK